MFKRIAPLAALTLVASLALSGCADDLSSRKTMHGDIAKQSLTKVVDDSIALMKKSGGTEQLTVGSQQYGLVYDPKAPASKQVAFFDVKTDGPSQYGQVGYIFLLNLGTLLKSDTFKTATYDYANSGFTVKAPKATLTVQVFDNKVNGTLLTSTADASQTQATIENYGINDVARAKLSSATPAPTATPAQ
jgi:hypothetical protein